MPAGEHYVSIVCKLRWFAYTNYPALSQATWFHAYSRTSSMLQSTSSDASLTQVAQDNASSWTTSRSRSHCKSWWTRCTHHGDSRFQLCLDAAISAGRLNRHTYIIPHDSRSVQCATLQTHYIHLSVHAPMFLQMRFAMPGSHRPHALGGIEASMRLALPDVSIYMGSYNTIGQIVHASCIYMIYVQIAVSKCKQFNAGCLSCCRWDTCDTLGL